MTSNSRWSWQAKPKRKNEMVRPSDPSSGLGGEVPAPYWDKWNPWSKSLIYVPINDLAFCKSVIGAAYFEEDGTHREYTADSALTQWKEYGEQLDAYVLPGPTPTGGIRYGKKPDEYLSPGFDPRKIEVLIDRYGAEPKAEPQEEPK